MSDIEVPNIDFDTETSLTTGPAHDDILGTAGNDLVIGAVDSTFTTLNPADIIRGGDGGEDMLSVTFTGAYPQAVGFLARDMDVFQVRNFTFDPNRWGIGPGDNSGPGEAFINMIDVTGTSTLWLDQPTGDTFFDNVQNLTDVVFTGGGFQGDTIGTHINFAPTVAGGADDTLELLLSGTMVDFEVNDYPGANGVENLWLQADGVPSDLEFEITGLNNVMVAGNSASVYLEQENYNGSNEYLTSFDSTGFAGMVEADLYVGNGSGTATVDTKHGADTLYLQSHSSSTVDINSRKGSDYVEIDNAYRLNLLMGDGDDTVYAGSYNPIGGGGIDVNTGTGEDYVWVNTTGDLKARTGADEDDLVLDYVGGNADIRTGSFDDDVSNSSGVQGFLAIDLGYGDDTLDSFAGAGASVIGALGADDITIETATGHTADITHGDVTVKAGSGMNVMDVDINGARRWTGSHYDYDDGFFFTGADADELTFEGTGHLNATLRAGNDIVNISSGGVSQQMWLSLGDGNDTVNLFGEDLASSDTIMGEGGNDLITANSLDDLNASGAFNNTTGVATVQTSSHYSSSTGFDGAGTGANGKITTYNLNGDISGSTYMRHMASDVTVNFKDSGGTNQYFEYSSSVASGGIANLNFQLTGSSQFNTFNLDDVATLNVVSNNSVTGTPELTLGGTDSFIADTDLTKIVLSGNNHFSLAGVKSNAANTSNLAMIDASGVSGRVYLDLDDVADDITVTTGTTGNGADKIWRDDTSTNYDITTNGGNDTVYVGGNDTMGGDDNIDLGSGNDSVEFTAATLDDFDTVDGGIGTDTMHITSGGLIAEGGVDPVNDDFFFLISNMENWILNVSTDNLELGNTAQSSGLQKMSLGNGSDKVTLKASYSEALEITIGNGTSNDTVDAGASGATLTVRAESNDVDGNDVITGGNGDKDELQIYAHNGGMIDLTGMTKVEKVTSTSLTGNSIAITAAQENFTGTDTLTVSMPAYFGSGQGFMFFDGRAATEGGNFDVTSYGGADTILGGSGNDTITTHNNDDVVGGYDGDDYISLGDGDDRAAGGLGADTIDGGTGDDSIAGDRVTAFDDEPPSFPIVGPGGIDVITGGTGADTIWGGAEGDIINVGNSEDADVDVLYYADQSESFGGSVDQVSGFTTDTGGDIVVLWDVPNTFQEEVVLVPGDPGDPGDPEADPPIPPIPPTEEVLGLEPEYLGQYFVGNAATFGEAQGLVTELDGIVDVVFQVDEEVLWVDINDDGTLNNNDLQIHLIGVGDAGGLQDNLDGTSDNLVLDIFA